MPSLTETLVRLGDGISEIIGPDQMKLIHAMGSDTSDQDALVALAIRLRGELGILRDSRMRKLVTDSLRKKDADQLAFQLGLEHDGSPYRALSELKYRKNSNNEKILMRYFFVDEPEQEELPEEKETITVVKPKHGLFPHQRTALMRIDDFLENEGGRAILHMPTGSGKTRTAMNLATKYLNQANETLILWLAHSEELCEQAAEEFEKAWSYQGDRDIAIRRFFKNHKWENTDDGIIVAGLDKLWSHLKKNQTELHWLAPKISLIIFDEAHQSIANTWKIPIDIITNMNSDCRFLGLTATPGRTWSDIDEDKKLSSFYNNKKVPLEVEGYDSPIKYLVDEGYLSKVEFHSLEYESTGAKILELESIAHGKDIPKSMLDELSSDGMRNSFIIEKVQELVIRHDRILFFATNVNHAKEISAFLNQVGIKSDYVTGATEYQERKRAISQFKEVGGDPRVLCNYGVLTTGFDAPLTSAAIIARPTTSLVLYSQMVGRAIRGSKVGGTETAEIWTVVDTNLPGFGDLVEGFTNWDDVW
ncbi:MAG: DEAD/DEAH box helicase [Candidatus Thalassarchaeaceae archaeon]|nr:DEAD/DEAH box helicase [Candidatus Thalassarchaeaceae archaeon]